ncbi:lipoprotein [Neisseriaceae bacterium ESL0693]|nr:lipoprotein [Neisseriaceae bacterium ESL0693]
MSRFLCFSLVLMSLLTACGYKGNLYLPKEGDKTQFKPVQTGLTITPINPENLPEHHDKN